MIKYINLISDKYKCRNCGKLIDTYGNHCINNINKKIFDDTESINQYVKLFHPIKHQCTNDTIGVADIASFKIEEVNSNDN